MQAPQCHRNTEGFSDARWAGRGGVPIQQLVNLPSACHALTNLPKPSHECRVALAVDACKLQRLMYACLPRLRLKAEFARLWRGTQSSREGYDSHSKHAYRGRAVQQPHTDAPFALVAAGGSRRRAPAGCCQRGGSLPEPARQVVVKSEFADILQAACGRVTVRGAYRSRNLLEQVERCSVDHRYLAGVSEFNPRVVTPRPLSF